MRRVTRIETLELRRYGRRQVNLRLFPDQAALDASPPWVILLQDVQRRRTELLRILLASGRCADNQRRDDAGVWAGIGLETKLLTGALERFAHRPGLFRTEDTISQIKPNRHNPDPRQVYASDSYDTIFRA